MAPKTDDGETSRESVLNKVFELPPENVHINNENSNNNNKCADKNNIYVCFY